MKGFGDILSDSWNEYVQKFKSFFAAYGLLYILPSLIFSILLFWMFSSSLGGVGGISSFLSGNVDEAAFVGINWASIAGAIGLMVIFGIVFFVLQILLAGTVVSLSFQKKASFSEAFGNGKKHFWKILGLALLIILVMIVLIIPTFLSMVLSALSPWFVVFMFIFLIGFFILFIWIAVRWFTFALYVLMNEDKGVMDSVKMNRKIVDGKWWLVFGYALLMMLILWVISFLIGLPGSFFSLFVKFSGSVSLLVTSFIVSFILKMVAQLVVGPLSVLFFKNFYLEMKNRK